MNPKLYGECLAKVIRDPILRSGVKMAKQVRLLDAIKDNRKPIGILALSQQTHLKERYVRELNYALTASRIIEINKNGEVFIPKGCEKLLMDAADKAAWEPHLERTLPILEDCFREGGRPGYTSEEGAHVMELVNQIRLPFNNKLAAEIAGNMKLHHTGDIHSILDVGCGTGDITIPLAQNCPGTEIIGCDVSELAIKSCLSTSIGVQNLSFTTVDGEMYPEEWKKKFDAILLFDVLHDLDKPEQTMTEVMKTLKDKGIMVIVDPKVSNDPLKNVGNLKAAQALTLSSFYCVPCGCCNHGHGAALGVSWGTENKEQFLNKIGLTIKSSLCFIGSDFNYAYICVKK